MSSSVIIERFGGLIKEEPLTCLEAGSVTQGTCVMEAESPFFGYYNEVPHTSEPHYLYCLLNGYYSLETFLRATQSVRKKYRKPFDAALGTITHFGLTCQVIRIRNLEFYSDIITLQNLFMDEGIMMKRKSRKFKNEMAVIKLRKFFYLEPVGDGLYLDRAEKHHGYFLVPRQLDWEEFKIITKEVKYHPSFFHFDGAIAFIYEKEQVLDMVRIYREKIEAGELEAIRDRYLNILKV